jgi:GNAT superfamily N-acetyltransferase
LDAFLSEREARRLLERDVVDHVVLLAIDGDHIRGIGEYAVQASPACAEVGIVVEDAFQGQGVGRLLYQHLEWIASGRGITSFIGIVHDQNRRMHRIFATQRRRVKLSPAYGGARFSVAVDPSCA